MGLKYSQGFTKILPSILTVIGMVASFYFLSLSLKSLPLGNAYAIWTGIGTVGTVVLGIILFKEPINVMRYYLYCIYSSWNRWSKININRPIIVYSLEIAKNKYNITEREMIWVKYVAISF